jgi:pimeloyl-ACP methyl ester carboxylesterase
MKVNTNRKVNINGSKLNYEYIDEVESGTTLVFESGYGWSLDNWLPIKNEISKFAKLFMYDRDGVGESEKSNKPKHSLQIVENLRLLLRETNIKPPYVLIGHSFGGVNVRLYASTYPEEVAGVILLDSCHEDQNRKMVPLFSKEVREQYLGQFTVEANLREFEETLEQVRGKNLRDIPLIVMTGGTQPFHTSESMDAWLGFQINLANLSSDSKHYIIKEAGHAIHIDRPIPVIEAIKEMLLTVKNDN